MAELRETSHSVLFVFVFSSPQQYCCHLMSKVLNSHLGCLAREKQGSELCTLQCWTHCLLGCSSSHTSGTQHRNQDKGKIFVKQQQRWATALQVIGRTEVFKAKKWPHVPPTTTHGSPGKASCLPLHSNLQQVCHYMLGLNWDGGLLHKRQVSSKEDKRDYMELPLPLFPAHF